MSVIILLSTLMLNAAPMDAGPAKSDRRFLLAQGRPMSDPNQTPVPAMPAAKAKKPEGRPPLPQTIEHHGPSARPNQGPPYRRPKGPGARAVPEPQPTVVPAMPKPAPQALADPPPALHATRNLCHPHHARHLTDPNRAKVPSMPKAHDPYVRTGRAIHDPKRIAVPAMRRRPDAR